MRRPSRRLVAIGLGTALLAAAGFAGIRLLDRPEQAVAADDGPDPAQTVAIRRTDISQAKDLDGDLGYGSPRTVRGRATGTITWLPKPGTTLTRGDVLYRADDKPVVLFYGSTPLFRPIGTPPAQPPQPPPAGKAPPTPLDGPDIEVVKQNLAALGFLATPGSDRLTPATTRAIKRWQRSLDLDQTGVINPATVVVLPGPVRVDGVQVALGDPAAADVLGVSSTEKVVTLPVDADEAGGIRAGLKVKLTLPNGKTTPGTVRTVSTDATAPPADGPADGDEKPHLVATIGLDSPAAATGLDSGPVTVTVPGPAHQDVLVVPVAALLALREGGYAVQVVTGTRTTLVGVTTGMFANGNIEITGKGLQAGQRVVTTS